MDAGGTLPDVPAEIFLTSDDDTRAFLVLRAASEARPDDDQVLELELYLASRLRRDGIGFMGAMLASGIVRSIVKRRPVPPPFAAKYAPTDEEVFRTFASEAMWLRHNADWFRRGSDMQASNEIDAELAMWQSLADAPQERAAFRAYIAELPARHPKSLNAPMLTMYADKLFEAVDAYRAWLAGS
jgi:hypothetical protein